MATIRISNRTNSHGDTLDWTAARRTDVETTKLFAIKNTINRPINDSIMAQLYVVSVFEYSCSYIDSRAVGRVCNFWIFWCQKVCVCNLPSGDSGKNQCGATSPTPGFEYNRYDDNQIEIQSTMLIVPDMNPWDTINLTCPVIDLKCKGQWEYYVLHNGTVWRTDRHPLYKDKYPLVSNIMSLRISILTSILSSTCHWFPFVLFLVWPCNLTNLGLLHNFIFYFQQCGMSTWLLNAYCTTGFNLFCFGNDHAIPSVICLTETTLVM